MMQATSLQEKIEKLNISKRTNSITLIDIVNIYLLLSCSMIEKVV